MFSTIYNAAIFNPLYNGLIALMDIFPWMDAGIAVIVFTIIVRLILFPLSKKAIVTQVRMKEIQPEVDRLRETMKNDREGQALKMMQLYKDKKVSPFSSILVLLIQLPVIYSLYSIFIRSGLPIVNTSLLYSYVNVPTINMHFLGLIDISQKSILLAVLAALAQFLQLHFSLAASTSASLKNPQMDMAHNMTKNMKYIFPVIVFFIAFKISAVVALYWIVTNLFTLAQELVVRRHLRMHQPL
jgi:YidC/Oxa1 family membrane protein insertase